MVFRNIIAAASLLAATSAVTAAPGIGDKVADTSFTTAFGQTMKIGDLRGEVVVLTYWMSDCEPCRTQLNILDYYYRERRALGLRVLAIASEDLSNRQLRYAFKGRMIHPLASIGGDFGPKSSFPTTYIIDRNGHVRYAASGALEIEQLNEILVPLLREPQP